mmetsp:Transcript_58463/g.67520  ORF Transcript_58463/g.67520 Transcript_58463/m.67520 type:complete len:199 (+) Transcript_58463:29-625(+)
MKTVFQLQLLLALLACTYSLHTTIAPRETFCVYKYLANNDKLTINYVSSGLEEQQINMKAFDLQGNVLREVNGRRESNTEIMAAADGAYRICWRVLDNNAKTLSFDLQTGDKVDKSAAADNIDGVSQEVRKAYKSLEQIFRNQHYQHTREEVHKKSIESLESKIQWCAILKILVLIVIAGIQVYILTGYFKNKKEFVV